MILNLAAAFCTNNDLVAASTCLGKLGDLTDHPRLALHAILLGVYIELRRGNMPGALALAKHHRLASPPAGEQ